MTKTLFPWLLAASLAAIAANALQGAVTAIPAAASAQAWTARMDTPYRP